MLAIHDNKGSFSDRWISICKVRSIPYVTVDIFSDDIFDKFKQLDVRALLMHPPMHDQRSKLVAKSIIQTCNLMNISTFPTLSDYWHFDDKVAQKYLFSALDLKTPDTHVFFSRENALTWIDTVQMPIVFKLKSGAGSINVALLRTKTEAIRHVNRMFGRGYPATESALRDISTKLRSHKAKKDWLATMLRLPNTLRNWWNLRQNLDWERGYIYFQEFVSGNDCDTRVTVIGNRAFAFRRLTRPGDVRASGSGAIVYDPLSINLDCVRMAFFAAKRLGSTCVAFDFILKEKEQTPLIVEISYGFNAEAVYGCSGYWSPEMIWNPQRLWPQEAILDDFLSNSNRKL
jgi:hypothetical protein